MTKRAVVFAALISLALPAQAVWAAESPGPGGAVTHSSAVAEALDIALRRDADALLRQLSDRVRIGHGPENGREDFVEWFGPEDPESFLWNDLITILSMASPVRSADEKGAACHPSKTLEAAYRVGDRLPDVDLERIAYPIGTATGMWAGPSVTSRLVTRVGLDTFFILGERVDTDWQRATILDTDLSGFVRRSDIRTAQDHFLCIRIDDAGWTITDYLFIEGG